MLNKITNTGIYTKNYNSRALVTHRGVTHALVRASDGVLWAAIRTGHVAQYITLMVSTDNGFSWKTAWRGNFTNSAFRRVGIKDLNQNGPFIDLCLFEDLKRLNMFHAYWDTSTNQYAVETFMFDVSDPNDVKKVTTDQPLNNAILLDQDFMTMRAAYNEHAIFLVSVTTSKLRTVIFRPSYQVAAEASATLDGTFYNVFAVSASRNGYLDIAVAEEEDTRNNIKFTKFVNASVSYTSQKFIYQQPAKTDIMGLNIARDGYGTLVVAWGEMNTNGTDVDVKFAISKDHGDSWSAPEQVAKSPSHGAYVDPITSQHDVRLQVLPGIRGFLFTYVRSIDGVGKTFVNRLDTPDGGIYTLSGEQEIGTHNRPPQEPVVGARFFLPPGTKLLDLADPGQVRLAFQVGEGNHEQQADTVPIDIGQELLFQSAYPSTLDSESGGYEIDPTTDYQIPVYFQVLGGPNDNTNYFALGLVGDVTRKYMAAFERVGTNCRILRYDPVPHAHMDDRSAYDKPVELFNKVIVSTQTYDFPTASTDKDEFTSYIEKDIRKIHLPPSFPLLRDFILNRGNHLKRTVWTITYGSNEYELTQVVPHFLNDQICFYSANAYVIGPSHDPFSRVILPSET